MMENQYQTTYTLTFEKAFQGKYAALTGMIDTSHGLWNQLLDREVLTHPQVRSCQVFTINDFRSYYTLLQKILSCLLVH